jgi:class 3 adenylate cyclase
MEPRIQYAQTKDGVSIAFYTLGEGMPLVDIPLSPFSHIQLEWQIPEWRSFYESLVQNRMVVRYDGRGSGLSERDVTDFSLDAHLLDLEAVVDCLGLERFTLYGGFALGPVAIAYAARHPERVSRLLLWCSWARASDAYRSAQAQTLIALRDKDWEIYTETAAHVVVGWAAGKTARRFAALMRESGAQEAMQAALGAATEFDVTLLLAQVKVPTLVLHRRQVPVPDLGVARGLASRIPGARLVVLEGTSLASTLGDTEAVLRAIDEFLGDEEAAAEPPPAGAFRTILFTDVEGSTALTDRLGDARAREVLREHERIVREALKAHGGSEVKTMGDGFMASFGSATRALECAIAMQRAFAEWNAARPSTGSGRAEETGSGRAEEIRVRIGLNAGEPIAEEEDLFGTAVILAARIAGKAEGGEILASDVVRQLVAGKGFLFADRGDVALRGFEDPVRLFEVRWREEA